MRRLLPILAIVAASGCRCGDTTMPAPGSLRFSPPALDFGEVYERARPTRLVEVTLDATFSCELTLAATAPFAVDFATVTVHGGDPAPVEVRFAPAGQGPASGTVQATGCGLSTTLPVNAQVVAALTCPADSACVDFAFDPDVGVCRRVFRPDGTPCSTPCLVSAQCLGGQCRGQAVSCDDAEDCTIDACLDDGSCAHLPARGTCPAPPACVQDCDGGPCPLVTAWTGRSVVPAEVEVSEPLLDDQGLYWLEHHVRTGACELVSASTSSGTERFRVPITCAGLHLHAMLADGLVLVGNQASRFVSAYETRNGALRWSTNVQGVLLDQLHLLGLADVVLEPGVVEDDVVVYDADVRRHANPVSDDWLVALDLATGAVRWTFEAGANSPGVIGDGLGHYAVRGPGPEFSVVTSTRLLWSANDQWVAFAGGRVFGVSSVRDALSGATLWTLAPGYLGFSYANERVALSAADGHFQLFDARTGAPLPHRRATPTIEAAEGAFPNGVAPQALLGDDSVLYVDRVAPSLTLAEILRADGGLALSCAVPEMPWGGSTVAAGRFYAWTRAWPPDIDTPLTLHAFVLPGAQPGTGWWLWRGGAGEEGRPR
jgi:hypothetical protein